MMLFLKSNLCIGHKNTGLEETVIINHKAYAKSSYGISMCPKILKHCHLILKAVDAIYKRNQSNPYMCENIHM